MQGVPFPTRRKGKKKTSTGAQPAQEKSHNIYGSVSVFFWAPWSNKQKEDNAGRRSRLLTTQPVLPYQCVSQHGECFSDQLSAALGARQHSQPGNPMNNSGCLIQRFNSANNSPGKNSFNSFNSLLPRIQRNYFGFLGQVPILSIFWASCIYREVIKKDNSIYFSFFRLFLF